MAATSRRGLFGLMGSAALASVLPKAALVAAAPEVFVSYSHTSYGLGYVVTREDAALWLDRSGGFRLTGRDAMGRRVSERVDA